MWRKEFGNTTEMHLHCNERIHSGICHCLATHNPTISARNGNCHIRKVSRTSITCKQQVEMWRQQPNSFFKQICYLECKRNHAPCLAISRVTRALDVCVYRCANIIPLDSFSVWFLSYIPVETIVIFPGKNWGFFVVCLTAFYKMLESQQSP